MTAPRDARRKPVVPGTPQRIEGRGPGDARVPEATVARLATYLRVLGTLADRGVTTVSSEELAVATGVNSAKLRKDLSYIGSYGTRGVGYEIAPLRHQLEEALGQNHAQSVALVGIGNLGHALAGYGGGPRPRPPPPP